jgi:hypothetical protein
MGAVWGRGVARRRRPGAAGLAYAKKLCDVVHSHVSLQYMRFKIYNLKIQESPLHRGRWSRRVLDLYLRARGAEGPDRRGRHHVLGVEVDLFKSGC